MHIYSQYGGADMARLHLPFENNSMPANQISINTTKINITDL